MNVRVTILGRCALALAAAGGAAEAADPSSPAAAVHVAQGVEAGADAGLLVRRFCVVCHNDRARAGDLSLDRFDATDPDPEIGERMIRKLRAGMMPPPGASRPDEAALLDLVEILERRLDAAAAPAPGRTFQRLNRAEYARAVRDLLALDVDPGRWLPPDQVSANFDNIADVQTLSPTLLQGYLNAASAVSRLAIGERGRRTGRTWYNSPDASQHPWDHVEGAPYGTRGGMVVDHVFPADAEYVFRVTLTSRTSEADARLEDLDVSIDGARAALLHYSFDTSATDPPPIGVLTMETPPVFVRAGPHRVAAAFVRRFDGPYEDLIRPHAWSFAGGGTTAPGITTLPHLLDVTVSRPYNETELSETPPRRRIFTCRPTDSGEARPCARRILTRLARAAYRREPTARDVDGLMSFFDEGARDSGFEDGVRRALEAMLASPRFVFRLERGSADAPGEGHRPSQAGLASRLSYFLWGAAPDDELLTLAEEGRLSPEALNRQASRMLADPRAAALGSRFAAQWLRLPDMETVRPDPNLYPDYSENLARAMRRETERFFNHLMRENRSLLELYQADYTFLDERLARHYGIPGVAGRHFRRVPYPDDTRRGILGHGSILLLTSHANRTSPVLRGKWVMEVLLGAPPPPPPPDTPAFETTEEARDGRRRTTRERMELHRSNPSCNSCHRLIDPIGLALDNFDVIGKWRRRENGALLDTRGHYYDGTPISTPRELADTLAARPIPLARTFTENLLAFAAGRRIEHSDQPVVRAIVRAAEADGYRMQSFVMGVIGSGAFLGRRGA